MIKWQDEYATGNESIDKQHQMLFEFFNDFEVLIQEGKGAFYLTKCFPMLEAYAQAHFKFEERCMHEHHCPSAEKNKFAHQIFLSKIQEFKSKFESNQYEENFFLEIHAFIEDWVTSHIIGIDTHLKKCIKH